MRTHFPLVALIATVGFSDALLEGVTNLGSSEGQGSASKPVNTRQSDTFPQWKPVQPGEVRSPCPGLNACAGHNICPRSGKGYSIPILTQCLKTCMNVGGDFALFVGGAGLASNPDPFLLKFDLDMLDHHNMIIEHDGSLSRGDLTSGNNYSFNQTIFDTVLEYYGGMENATIPVAARARYNRILMEKARDPNFTYGPAQVALSYGETALYLSAMGDPHTGIAPVEYVKVLFEQERLPYEEGWRPSAEPITLDSLATMIVKLNDADGHELPEGMNITEGTLKQVLTGSDPVSGAVVYPVLRAVGKLIGTVFP